MGAVMEITAKNFKDEVEKSDLPVLIDFWAEWCGPCRMVAPIVEQISIEMSSKLKVGKVNVDDEQDLAMHFNVLSIPTLILFKKGQIAETIVGALPREQILAKIKPKL